MKIGYRNIGIIQAKTLMQQRKILFPKIEKNIINSAYFIFSFNFISNVKKSRHLKVQTSSDVVFFISFFKKCLERKFMKKFMKSIFNQ